MSRRWPIETFVAVLASIGLIAAPLVAAHAADTVVANDDFSTALSDNWRQSGSPTSLSIEDVEGDPALRVEGRANNYDGIETAPGVLQAGETYEISLRVRLAAGTSGTPLLKIVSVPGYGTVGSELPVTDAAWTTLTGTVTFAADATDTKVYIGSSDLAGPYDYLVDDVVVTHQETTTPPPGTVIASDDFSTELSDNWRQSGSPSSLTIVDVGGDPALQIAGRANNYDGIETSPGVLDPGATYTVTLDVRLAAGTVGSALFKIVSVPGYGTVGSELPVTDAAWTTLTGTVTFAADATDIKVYIGSADLDGIAGAYTYLVDDIQIVHEDSTGGGGGSDPGTPGEVVYETGFESGLAPWQLRRSSDVPGVTPEAAVTTEQFRSGAQSAVVSSRGNQGDGLGLPVVGTLLPGLTYELSAWVRFAPGQPADAIWVTLQADSSFLTQAQVTGMSNGEWRQVEASITMPANELTTGLLYFETAYVAPPATGNTSTFYVDDVTITQAETLVIQDDLTPIKDTVEFPVGVAIDSRETSGAQSQLVNLHFEQLTSENFMKPEAFYTGQEFTPNAEGDLLMQYALDNDLRVWGHTLVWHSQTPAWFFQDDEGAPLTTSEADRDVLRERMRDHIFAVAEHYADEYGLYGGGNPLVAFDVVNEVVNDGSQFDDGLRRSEWYRILGEEFIDLAFDYADEAFNETFAADGADRPVALFINDYNTEQAGKQNRMYALLQRLLDRNVPVDGLGHQFHVSLSFPVAQLGATIDRFSDLPLTQAVTELDVTTGTPETEALFIDQGYYYRDAFRDFRERSEELFSVTIWGLTDNRSWRSASGGPLLFDERLQAKPAYYGVVDEELEAPLRAANVFGGSATSVDDPQWQRLPSIPVEDRASFQLRWSGATVFVFVDVEDATVQASDAVSIELEGTVTTVERSSAQRSTTDGWSTVVQLDLPGGAAEGATLDFDLAVTDGGSVAAAWNAPGVLGTLTLREHLSFVEVPEASVVPTVDGDVDDVWASAGEVTTGKQVTGTDGATATVRTLWSADRLYVLMEVTDAVVDVSGSDPWLQDSVEIYVDSGNVKNGSYRYDDTQIRISADNVLSFGSGGDEAFQRARVDSATQRTDTGYVVEASISLLDGSGLGTVHGLDFQVNDAEGGARQSIRNWADPSGQGYLSTARWGVGQLVEAPESEPAIELGSETPRAGDQISFVLTGLEPNASVELFLVEDDEDSSASLGMVAASTLGLRMLTGSTVSAAAAPTFPLSLGVFTADANGRVIGTVTIPASVPPGNYRIIAVSLGTQVAAIDITVAARAGGGAGSGLAATGLEANPVGIGVASLLLLGLGVALVAMRRARRHDSSSV